MALADRVKIGPKERVHGNPCSVGHLLSTLEGSELDAFKEMLGTPERRGWTQDEIYEAVRAEGLDIGRQSINRHRAGSCRCAKADQ